MKYVHTFESFLNESIDVNEAKIGVSTLPQSDGMTTWLFHDVKDPKVAARTARAIHKKLDAIGIKTNLHDLKPNRPHKFNGGLVVTVPTRDMEKAFDQVISKYDNIKQFAYRDGTVFGYNPKIVHQDEHDLIVNYLIGLTPRVKSPKINKAKANKIATAIVHGNLKNKSKEEILKDVDDVLLSMGVQPGSGNFTGSRQGDDYHIPELKRRIMNDRWIY